MSDWITDREPEEGVAVLAILDGDLMIATLSRDEWHNVYDCLGQWNGSEWEYDCERKIPVCNWQWQPWQPLTEPPTPPRSNAEETDKW